MSKETEKVSAIYSKIFDRKINHVPKINYHVIETGAESEWNNINGASLKTHKPRPWPGNMLFYILVDDLAAYRKKVVAAGGKIQIEEHKVPRMGKFSLFTDPEGRMMGLWKAKQ